MGEQDQGHEELFRIIAKAWAGDDFKQLLLADPKAALRQEGVAVRADINIKVVEDTPELIHLVIPPKPAGELTEDTLAKIAGGGMRNPNFPNW